MKKFYIKQFIAFLGFFCCVVNINAQKQEESDYVKGEIILELSIPTFEKVSETGLKSGREFGSAALDALNGKFGVTEIEPLIQRRSVSKARMKSRSAYRMYVLKTDENTDIRAACAEYRKLKEVAAVSPNLIFKLSGPTVPPEQLKRQLDKKPMKQPAVQKKEQVSSLTMLQAPNDPYFGLQWGHHNPGNSVVPYGGGLKVGTADCDADVLETWDITTGSEDVIVVVLDTGIDTGHPEFAGRLLPGYNAAHNTTDITDTYGHGTLTAGILGANGNNGMGIAGMDWKCKILPVKILDNSNNFNVKYIIKGLNFAEEQGADIVTMSFGYQLGSGFTMVDLSNLQVAVKDTYSAGITLFAATGNDDKDVFEYPAAFPEVIAVGAHSPCNERKKGGKSPLPFSCDNDTRKEGGVIWGSNYGDYVDFVAPGVLLPTTNAPGGLYSDDDYILDIYGTSLSSPFAAGIAALMLSVNPDLTNVQIREIMQQTAVDIGEGGFDNETGHGRVNALAAVQGAIAFPCLQDNSITHTTFFGSTTQAVVNTFTLGPAVEVDENADVEIIAGTKILLNPSFKAPEGSKLILRIDPDYCDGGGNMKALSSLDDAVFSEAADKPAEGVSAFPNPFTGTVRFEFELPKSEEVTLVIFDGNGREVERLLDASRLSEGKQRIEFDGSRLAPGLYIYNLLYGEEKVTGKMLKTN